MPWPVFPQCPAFGFTSIPDYDVTIVERASGWRTVNRNWYYPLHIYAAVPIGDKPEDDIHRLLRFWHAIGGQSGRFLFKDYVDYKSTNALADSITAFDQPLVYDEDAAAYRLVKLYRDDLFLFTQTRIISKPKSGTISLGADGSPLVSGYTINYGNGLVTGLDPPGTSTPDYTWGGEFYVPAMFETKPNFVITNKNVQSSEFAVRELRVSDEDV